jgi:hypothetical protein
MKSEKNLQEYTVNLFNYEFTVLASVNKEFELTFWKILGENKEHKLLTALLRVHYNDHIVRQIREQHAEDEYHLANYPVTWEDVPF